MGQISGDWVKETRAVVIRSKISICWGQGQVGFMYNKVIPIRIKTKQNKNTPKPLKEEELDIWGWGRTREEKTK